MQEKRLLRQDPGSKKGERHGPNAIPYLVATALCHGPVSAASFTDECLHDPNVRALMKKTTVDEDEQFTQHFPDAYNCSGHSTWRLICTPCSMISWYHKGRNVKCCAGRVMLACRRSVRDGMNVVFLLTRSEDGDAIPGANTAW